MFLVVTLFTVAVHFALMGADFIAALQVLIYAGAIMVLVVFVIMLLGLQPGPGRGWGSEWTSRLVALVVTGIFVGVLLVAVNRGEPVWSTAKKVERMPVEGVEDLPLGSADAVGQELFTRFVVPFEIIGVLLFAAVIAAALLAHEPKRPLAAGRGLKAKQQPES